MLGALVLLVITFPIGEALRGALGFSLLLTEHYQQLQILVPHHLHKISDSLRLWRLRSNEGLAELSYT